jgi:Bardet-Biedl syndrome 2 protein
MKRFYRQLHDLNKDLIAEHDKRATNHNELLEALKEVNQMIQRSSKLRVGGAKTKVVNACRAAIKANNIQSLFNIIRTGDVTSV